MKKKFIKGFLFLICAFLAAAWLIYWVGSDQMEAVKSQTSTVTPSFSDGGLAGSNILEQKFQVRTDTLDQLLLYIGTYGRQNSSSFTLQIYMGNKLLWQQGYMATELKDLSYNAFMLNAPLEGIKGKELILYIITEDVPIDQAITFYGGNTISASKAEVAVELSNPWIINGQEMDGMLCLSLIGRDLLAVKDYYWPAVAIILCLLCALYWEEYIRLAKHGKGLFVKIQGLTRYTFLMKQMIARDFKTKYKRSVLGVLWSFLNPLLTMGVQYLIFSSIFKSNIENFAVYLMTGVVIYNFFAESVGLGLTSIVANASLITKVYVPKYIYPTTRVLSSSVNVLISMVPLCLLVILSGLHIEKSILLLPVVLAFTAIFCIGMSLILSSLMVFFRDIQFLWGVLSMLWMYMTPIFYPESIIPQNFLKLYHMNPLYQFIYFLREIVINGAAPSPYTYLYCALASFIPLLIGLWVFKKTQDRFVLYL